MSSRLPVQKYSSRRLLTILFWGGLISLIIFLLLYRLNDWPSVWWDEGWTLSAARNWVEHGHLGDFINGQFSPPRIPVRFPVVTPVALSMKLFGIGIWQGRLPGVIFTVLSLVAVKYLCSNIFDQKTGLFTILVMLFLSSSAFNPIIMGRQVLAEMPMLFYLLAGYCFVWLALTRSLGWGVGAAILFGLAIHAKLQVPPFWIVSILLALLSAVHLHQRRSLRVLIGISLGSLLFAGIILLIQNLLMPGAFSNPTLLQILINTAVFVPSWRIRGLTMITVLIFALPQLIGFIWAGIQNSQSVLARAPVESNHYHEKVILRLLIWGLGASWFVWYISMAMSWPRYLFPPFFIGCIFVAAYVNKITEGFNSRLLVQRIYGLIVHRQFNRQNLLAITLLIVFAYLVSLVIITMSINIGDKTTNPSLATTVIRNVIPNNARVETFESELLFLVPELDYHIPPDLVSMQLVRKETIDSRQKIDYNPVGVNPDYLVIGQYAQTWHLYDQVEQGNGFRLVAEAGGYQIFQRKNVP